MSAGAIGNIQAWAPPQQRPQYIQTLAQLGVISTICLAILVPAIHLTPDLSIKIELPISLIVVGVYGWLLLTGFARPIQFNGMFLIGALFAFSITLSMLYGSQVLGHNLILNDLFEPPKIFLLVLYFTITYEAELSDASLQRLLNFVAVAVALVCLYGWGQFFDAGFTYKLNPYFSGGSHHDLGLEHHHRVYATMGNPNVLGEILTWFLVLYTMAFLFRIGNQLRNVVIAFMCLMTSVMTASRYSLLASVVGFVLIIATTATALRRRATQVFLLLFLLLPLFVWTFMTVEMTHRSTFERFEALKHPMEVDSLQERLNKVWVEAIFYFEKSPFVGHGPAKYLFAYTWDDSEYLGVLKKYGVVGFVPYLSVFLFPLFRLWKGLAAVRGRAGPLLEQRYPLSCVMTRFGFAMVVMALFMNIGMSTFYSDPIQGLTMLLFGLTVRCAKTVADASADLSPSRRPFTRPLRTASLVRQQVTP